ncbi:hypothetical protein QGM71_01115 [Virgibacillus sp. C22-A2]|uniref:DUF1642 domain-containing protein n=1 Tax=Virgibacillus tibetensis TaxID=3042313 RepID=A0ABU6K9R0_9BACI|nr:hypothetical protein [Virgibacillus sp. C22-A2]
MNLPKELKFKYRDKIYYAEVSDGTVNVTWDDITGEPATYEVEKVKEYIGEGAWIILDDKYGEAPKGKTDYEIIAKNIGKLVAEKNKQYGDSFNKSGDFLKLLYPDGIKPEQYKDMLGLVRVFDKQMRIANGNQGEENAWQDINGYSLVALGGNDNE